MPVLRNKRTGADENVPDELLQQARDSGDYDIPAGIGKVVATPAGKLATQPLAIEEGYKAASPEARDELAHRQYAEREYGGLGGALKVGVESAVDTASFGAYGALRQLADPLYAERKRDEISVHEGADLAGTAAGAILPGILSGGAGAAGTLARITPAGAAARLGGRIAAGGSGGLGRAALGFGVEGALQGAGAGVQALTLSEDPLTFERAVGTLSTGALLGGVTSALAGAGGKAAEKGLGRMRRAVGEAKAARATALQGEVTDDLVDLDARGLSVAEKAEQARIEADRVPQREQLVRDVAAERAVAKAEKPWIAVEGFKGETKKAFRARVKLEAKAAAAPVAAAAAPEPTGFIDAVRKSAEGTPGWVQGSKKTFISDVHGRLVSEFPEYSHVSLDDFKRALSEANRSGDLSLARADLRGAMDPAKVEASSIKDGIGEHNFIDMSGPASGPASASSAYPAPRAPASAPAAAGRAPSTKVRSKSIKGRDGGQFKLEVVEAPQRIDNHESAFQKNRFLPGDEPTTWARIVQMRNGEPVMIDGVPKVVGHAQLIHRADGTLYPRNVEVFEQFRRQGLAGKMYAEAEKRTGRSIVASATQTADGQAFSSAFRGARDVPVAPASSAGPAVRLTSLPPELASQYRVIGKQTLKADRALDSLLDDPKGLTANPQYAAKALRMQEHALEQLQRAAPDLRVRMAADPGSSGARETALASVDGALVRNRELQRRLVELTAPPSSPRMDAIKAARDELMTGRRGPGALQQAGTAYAAAALTGLAPGGPLGAAGAVLASRAAKWVFGRLMRSGAESAARTARALDALLSGTRKITPAAARGTAATLAKLSFAVGEPAPTRPRGLEPAFRARAAELMALVERGPDGKIALHQDARRKVADTLSGVAAADPLLADQMETHVAKRIAYVAEKLPKEPDLGGMQIGPSRWKPSDRDMRRWARIAAAVEDPGSVEERLAAGILMPDEAEAYREVYPERWGELRRQVIERLPALRRSPPRDRRLALSIFLGVPVDPSLSPPILRVMQGMYTEEPGTEGGTQAPVPAPQFGSISREQPTPSQRRESGGP